MRRLSRSAALALTVLPVVTGALAACGGSGGSGDDGGGARPTVTIGVIAPESGALAATGKSVVAAVRMAVTEADAQDRLAGWKVRVVSEDDSGRPDVGAKVAGSLAGDPSVIGVVGPLNSGVAMTVAPVLAAAGVAVISPSATDPALTGAGTTGARTRPYGTFFRMVATDAAEGPAAAGYLVRDLHARRVVAVPTDQPYATGITASVLAAARADGATATTTVPMAAGSDVDAVAARIVAAHPDGIFLATGSSDAARLLAALGADGVTAPVLGADGTHVQDFADRYADLLSAAQGTAEAAGTPAAPPPPAYTIDFGSPPDRTAAGRAFLARFRAFTGDTGPHPAPADGLRDAAAAYDAATILLRGLPTAMAGRTGVDADARAAEVTRVAAASLTGASGPVSFDRYGDPRTAQLTIYRVTADGFTVERTVDVP